MCLMNKYVVGMILAAAAAGCASHHRASTPAPPPVAMEEYPYHAPLSTPGARFATLPVVVQNTVRTEAGSAEITDVRKETHDDHVYYRILFRDERNYPPLFIGGDGSVLYPDLTVAVPAPQQTVTEVNLNDVPLGVLRVIQARPPPAAEVASVSKENWGDHTIYIVSFKDDVHNPKLYVVADGTVLIKAPQ